MSRAVKRTPGALAAVVASRSGRALASVAGAVRAAVPVPLRRLLWHELLLWASLLRWVARRPQGVGPGDTAVAYAGAQAAMAWGLLFVSVVETVALAFLIPWPLVHAVLLVVDVWGVFFVVGLHASCVVRPHVVGADGSLRVRYGALVDVTVPAHLIVSARVDRRYPTGSLLHLGADDAVDLIVGSSTTVTVRLAEPVAFRRPLGRTARARTLRFHADEPGPLVAALAPREPEAKR
ncbi:hypothetical protein RM572_23630 [Streptomyces sp. DSM 42041]|uniref:Integral membrane protein n=1 Tax=Streptomyces hazeniae TaxID=3075538 RepID=A0ABU2NYP9_9ACTN|nr:hypothetical protein [Streptomyces sp. DSM 42041]MDT0381756.1 hypothetical protein [Streptomyces sp. DSM 42041]